MKTVTPEQTKEILSNYKVICENGEVKIFSGPAVAKEVQRIINTSLSNIEVQINFYEGDNTTTILRKQGGVTIDGILEVPFLYEALLNHL